MKADFERLESLVRDWARERGIYDHSTAQAQVLKAVSEMGELADAVTKRGDVEDAIGDIMVCLTHVAAFHGLSLIGCYAAAYQEIKDRKGRMVPGGTFVKD